MIVCRTVRDFREQRAKLDGTLGLVPTMGYLHKGHLSLVDASVRENDFTAASIFVNPTQFNDPNDLKGYPRDEKRDLELLESNGVMLVLMPSPDEMYPEGFQTYVNVEQITQGLEGEHRPGHFKGVTTVVAKLFMIVQPHRAYFGQKDAQQVAVIRQMVRDLNIPIEVKTCPTVREEDGLAMSSRNAKLSEVERGAAVALHKGLSSARMFYLSGERHPDVLKGVVQATLNQEPMINLEYISAADAATLDELKQPSDRPILLSLAAFVGKTRLIDNILLGDIT